MKPKSSFIPEKHEISLLNERIQAPLEDFQRFDELPISGKTIDGLVKNHFIEPTEIQRKAIPKSLMGLDTLAFAQTGSGKTLSFLIPLLEKLYREKWTKRDGLGALVITPTRELAIQIFEVLCKIGVNHHFSAGLVIGGKNLKQESSSICSMNILVATPGRLLQHLDQSPDFDYSNLQILVLDEADRILDLGFSKTVNAIMEFLPKSRQTLLFSATSSENVSSLAKSTLRSPITVSTYSDNISKPPSSLKEFYIQVNPEQKTEKLFSFLKTHVKSKAIVFLSSCKQVRFFYEVFCKLQPGIVLLSLHGKQKQHQRMDNYDSFCKKESAILFSTDIAARGLDFPSIDWVVHLDCPEDIETYIHRAGRTARNNSIGSSLLFLSQDELFFIEKLAERQIIVKSMRKDDPSTRKNWNITSKLSTIVSQSTELKYLAQKAIVSYLRARYLLRNQNNFSFQKFPVDSFAHSYGLIHPPVVNFGKASSSKNTPYLNNTQPRFSDGESDDELLKVKKVDQKVALKVHGHSLKYANFIPQKVNYNSSDEDSPLEESKNFLDAEYEKIKTRDIEDRKRVKTAKKENKLKKRRTEQYS